MLIKNSIQCNKCKDILVSQYNHDFVRCGCGECFTDGGLGYQRTAGDYTNLSIYDDAPFEIIRANFVRGTYGEKRDEPLQWVALKDLSNEHLKNIIVYEEQRKGTYLELYKEEKRYRKYSCFGNRSS